MYFDAVIDSDMQVVFNGTPEETQKWLYEQRKETMEGHRVVIGSTLAQVSISDYLRNSDG